MTITPRGFRGSKARSTGENGAAVVRMMFVVHVCVCVFFSRPLDLFSFEAFFLATPRFCCFELFLALLLRASCLLIKGLFGSFLREPFVFLCVAECTSSCFPVVSLP